jgi:hypothetical protein
MVVLTIKEPIVWAVGLVFALAFLLQAVARRGEGNRLAAQYFRARDAEEIEGQLVAHSRELEMGKTPFKAEEVIAELQRVLWQRLAASRLDSYRSTLVLPMQSDSPRAPSPEGPWK